MKAILLFVSLICAIPGLLSAAGPGPEVKLSKSFAEPVDGNTRLLMMKNGNTLLFHFMPKGGIKVAVYDSTGKQKKTKILTGKEWDADDLAKGTLGGLYEINGNAVIFLVQMVKKRLSLIRIVIDPQTAAVKQEDNLAASFKYNIFKGYAMFFGGVAMPEIRVEKDPESDYYAICVLNSFSSDRSKRLEIVHYDGTHQEINRAFYDSPNGTYKYIDPLAMYVHRDEFVFISSFGYNTATSGGKDSRIIISRLDKGATKFDHQLLDYTDDFSHVEAALQYDTTERTVQMLTLTTVERIKELKGKNARNTYATMLHFIDPAKLTVKHKHFLENTYASSYAQEKLGYKHSYTGIPQNFVINPDHSITVMSEEIVQTTTSSGNTSSTTTDLGDIGISRYDKLGQEVGGFAVAKKQQVTGIVEPLYIYRKNHGAWSFRTGSIFFTTGISNKSFFSYEYVHSGDAEYVLFNDYVKNTEGKETSKSKKTMRFVSGTNTICYQKKNNQVEKFYLFGDPGEKEVSRFVILEGSARSPDQKTFATIMLENNGNSKRAFVAWIKF